MRNKVTVQKAAAVLGSLGGMAKSARKSKAARRNGELGGWPKGKPRKPTQMVSKSRSVTISSKALKKVLSRNQFEKLMAKAKK